ncbi:MAG: hypothetical protein ACYDHD_02430 [Vulcanimicrobiaceae bacterium]
MSDHFDERGCFLETFSRDRYREAGIGEPFAVLVDRYKRGVANFIGGSIRDSADVADLTQETFKPQGA